MIEKEQYFESYEGKICLAVDDATKEPYARYWEVDISEEEYAYSYTNSPITVRRMFELLECPVPEGAKVCQFIASDYGMIYWAAIRPCGGVLGISENGWDRYAFAPSKDTLDLSNLPVTDEVIESLPESLQKKWKELL